MRRMTEQKANESSGPKSFCFCGHTGDGENSQHADEICMGFREFGSGKCLVKGCDCTRFTWKGWIMMPKRSGYRGRLLTRKEFEQLILSGSEEDTPKEMPEGRLIRLSDLEE